MVSGALLVIVISSLLLANVIPLPATSVTSSFTPFESDKRISFFCAVPPSAAVTL